MPIALRQWLLKLRETPAHMNAWNANTLLFGQCQAALLALVKRLEQADALLNKHIKGTI